jgi:hypothetical protein
MKNKTSITTKLSNNANLLLPAVFSPDVKPVLNPNNNECEDGHSYPIMVLLNSGGEYLNFSDVVKGFYDHKNKYWYIAFDGNGYTATKYDSAILGWRYLTYNENNEK